MVCAVCLSALLSAPGNAQKNHGIQAKQHRKATATGQKGQTAIANPISLQTVQPPVEPPANRLDLQPASPPRMSLVGGQLTINANNSTLIDILNGFQRITGTKIENSVGISPDRVVGQFGPGSPRDVLTAVMNGTNYNYIMLSKENDPGNVKQLIITLKTSGPSSPAMAATAVRPPPVRSEGEPPSEEVENEMNNVQQNPPPQPIPPPPVRPEIGPGAPNAAQPNTNQPGMIQPGNAQPQQLQPTVSDQSQTQGQPQPKTPEQLLEELRNMRRNPPPPK